MLDTEFGSVIKNEIDSEIQCRKFFALNRTVRNNLHYKETKVLSQEEIELVDKNQLIYLNTVKKLILENIHIDIDKECIRVTNFFNACHKKGLAKSEVLKHQYYYYVKFLIFGKL